MVNGEQTVNRGRKRLRIEDKDLVLGWIEAGVPYAEIVRRHEEMFGHPVTFSALSKLHSRATGVAKTVRYDDALPWRRKPGSTDGRLVTGLRYVIRMQRGEELPERHRKLALQLIARLEQQDAVVDYDYEWDKFLLVPRRHGIDKAWIRDPFYDDDGNDVPVSELKHLRLSAIVARRYDTGDPSVLEPSS